MDLNINIEGKLMYALRNVDPETWQISWDGWMLYEVLKMGCYCSMLHMNTSY